MIYGADIDELVERKAVADSPVLSVYLDVDQSRASNLKRKFEVSQPCPKSHLSVDNFSLRDL